MARWDIPERFFIGYLKRWPQGLALFGVAVATAVPAAFVGTAFGLGSTVDDPGGGSFRFDLGQQHLVGTIEAAPYPILRMPATAERGAHAMLLSGVGKVGAQGKADPFDGKAATATGILLKRGDIDMLQVDSVEAAAESPAPAPRRSLGRWRLTGEICDGKCYTGAMRPGSGLAHKACANLCLFGGIPPVFVATAPVEGSPFFLLADPEGRALPPEAYADLTAVLVVVEGEVERVDDLNVLAVDLTKARRP